MGSAFDQYDHTGRDHRNAAFGLQEVRAGEIDPVQPAAGIGWGFTGSAAPPTFNV
jgi:hypothetical protein